MFFKETTAEYCYSVSKIYILMYEPFRVMKKTKTEEILPSQHHCLDLTKANYSVLPHICIHKSVITSLYQCSVSQWENEVIGV